MSSLGGRLYEVVAYESLDHTGSKFCLITYGNCRDLPCVLNALFIGKVNFEKKSDSSRLDISIPCTIQERDNVRTPYYPVSTLLSVKCSSTGG